MHKLGIIVLPILFSLAGCSPQQMDALNSINQGFVNASAFTAQPPVVYQQVPTSQTQTEPIPLSQPWKYPNQPIGTCASDSSSGNTNKTCY